MIYDSTDQYIRDNVRHCLDEYADNYDLDAIAHDMLTWHTSYTPSGEIDINRSGYIERDDRDFWEIVANHEN